MFFEIGSLTSPTRSLLKVAAPAAESNDDRRSQSQNSRGMDWTGHPNQATAIISYTGTSQESTYLGPCIGYFLEFPAFGVPIRVPLSRLQHDFHSSLAAAAQVRVLRASRWTSQPACVSSCFAAPEASQVLCLCVCVREGFLIVCLRSCWQSLADSANGSQKPSWYLFGWQMYRRQSDAAESRHVLCYCHARKSGQTSHHRWT